MDTKSEIMKNIKGIPGSSTLRDIRSQLDTLEEINRVHNETLWMFLDALCAATERSPEAVREIVKIIRNRKAGVAPSEEQRDMVVWIERFRGQ